MTDNEIKTIDIEKYVEALNNLLGVDNAYFNGDKDVDAIVEIIVLAKKFEGIIKGQKAEIERLHKALDEAIAESDAKDIENYEIAHRVRAEAIQEFAEGLKATVDDSALQNGDVHFVALYKAIDEVAKELTE